MHRLLLLALAGLALAACDSGPTSVEDFDIQPAVTVSTTSLTFTAGQMPAVTFTVRYQGLDAAPEVEAADGVAFELVEETGSPESGSRTWAVSYTGEVPSAGSVMETVTVRSASGGREILDEVQLQVNSPVSITETFQSGLAVVADYDARAVVASGGTTTEVVTDGVSDDSNGLRALRVTASGSGSVMLERLVNAPGQGVFTFLVKPDPATDFTLEVTFTDRDGGETETYDVSVPVDAGSAWRKYTVATPQIFEGFDPVAERAGGNGPLESVSFAADAAVTYHLDDVAFGTADGPTIEVHDFEETTNAYGSFSAIELSDTDAVGAMSDGRTARRLSYTEGGNFFGYNYDRLRLNATSESVLSLLVGEVSRPFDLFVFVETVDDGGRAGGFSFDNGTVIPIAAGDEFRRITVPLADLGNDVSALGNPGIVNVGFELRRPESDATTEPIEVVIDDVKLQARP
jgi:hypothetical protein